MIANSKYFTYNNISLSTFEGMRIGTESNEMYGVQVISERVIFEEKIPGRKAPYFYGIDDQPLTLEITVALEKPKPISELRQFLRFLFNNDEYKPLIFDSDPNKIYYAIFIGSPEFKYIDLSSPSDIHQNDRKLIGYITLTARCNAGTAFGPAISRNYVGVYSNDSLSLINNGDDVVFPSIRIKVVDNELPQNLDFFTLSIENTSNNTKIEFSKVYRNEEILVDMSIRRITTEGGSVAQNIYESWLRNYLSLESGANNIFVRAIDPNNGNILNVYTELTSTTGFVTDQVPMDVSFTYQPIRYI